MVKEKLTEEEIKYRIKTILEKVRPYIQRDGGDMEYVGLDDENKVHLNLTGACGGCPMAMMTLKMGVERYIKDACPEVSEVVQDNAKQYDDFNF